jgi:hypothetical protein
LRNRAIFTAIVARFRESRHFHPVAPLRNPWRLAGLSQQAVEIEVVDPELRRHQLVQQSSTARAKSPSRARLPVRS